MLNNYLNDKDEGNQGGKVLLGEPRNVTYQGTGIDRNQDNQNYSDPGANP